MSCREDRRRKLRRKVVGKIKIDVEASKITHFLRMKSICRFGKTWPPVACLTCGKGRKPWKGIPPQAPYWQDYHYGLGNSGRCWNSRRSECLGASKREDPHAIRPVWKRHHAPCSKLGCSLKRACRAMKEDVASEASSKKEGGGLGRLLGRGIISGAADDDPSAIGTYASAGARFGPDILWTAPVTLPMMFTVVYLSSKLGQVSGRGLFHAIRDFYPRWLLWTVLAEVIIGNTIEATADLGGMAAAINLSIRLPIPAIVAAVAVILLCLQVAGSYMLIRRIFRWLAMTLLAYVGAALLARPDFALTLRGSLIPSVEFNKEFLSIIVAIIGTTLSAYLYTWQSNEEVEDEIAEGRTTVRERQGASERDLRQTKREILAGMTFSNLIMYFVILDRVDASR